jgi:hypothetical protein
LLFPVFLAALAIGHGEGMHGPGDPHVKKAALFVVLL